MFDVIDYPWDLAIFHFPCTHTSVSGAKHFAAKKLDGRHYAGVALFMQGWRRAAHIPKVCFEHPVSVISTLFRPADQIVQPWQFGHGETKQTCLWLRGLPKLEPTQIVEGRADRIHKMGPSDDRAEKRSETYTGIAEAMARQWGGQQQAQVAESCDKRQARGPSRCWPDCDCGYNACEEFANLGHAK